jgi:hypothetical protein
MWIEGLAAMLFLLAFSVACSARRSRRLGQLALPLATALLILGLASVLTYGAALLKFRFHGLIPHDWFFYSLSWTIVFAASTIRIFSRGLKRSGAEQVPPARSWPRGRLALALAGALVLFAITLSNMDLAVKMQLDEARAEASSLLLAMTPPPIADKDNAAPLYEEAFAALTPLERFPSRWRGRMANWNQKEWQSSGYWTKWEFPDRLADQFDFHDQEWKALLDSQAKGLALLRKAASKPLCRFPQSDPLAFFDGTGLRYDTNSYFAQAAQLLALDARVQATAGDTQTAVDDIVALLGIARHMSDGAVEKEGWVTLAAVLQLSAPSSRDLSRLLQVEGTPYLREFPKVQNVFALRILVSLLANWPASWFWDLSRELPFLHRRGKSMPEGYEAPMWFQGTIVPLVRVFLFPDDLLFIQRSLHESRQALQSPPSQPFADWQELKLSLEEQRGGYLFLGPWKTRLQANARFACDVATLRRMSRIAIALKMYKAKHGKYADSLDDLTPAFLDHLPSDPWDGGRLHSKRTEKGAVIYTLRNGTDKPVRSPNTSKERRDLVFHLEDK